MNPDETLRANYQRTEARVYTGNGGRSRGRAILGPTVAVLTAIDDADARALCAAYGLAAPERIEGIAGGSVNSNYSLEVGGRRFFLRLYEERDLAGALRETAMLERLARAGVPTPPPLRRADGELASDVRGKAAALFPWREGHIRCQAGVTAADASGVGQSLARVHEAGRAETAETGRFELADLEARLDRIAAGGDARFVTLVPGLRDRLRRADAARDRDLPAGLTHGDLFRDNVLWDARGELSALLDFESACRGTFAYDLMVTVLSWCFGDDLDGRLARAMVEGYERARPLTGAEREGIHAEGVFAALRFTVTRITDYAMRTGAEGPRVVKDWRRFMKRFQKLEELGAEGLRGVLWA
jgi:homoserine kinase type II